MECMEASVLVERDGRAICFCDSESDGGCANPRQTSHCVMEQCLSQMSAAMGRSDTELCDVRYIRCNARAEKYCDDGSGLSVAKQP
jgi:hypothetical protein